MNERNWDDMLNDEDDFEDDDFEELDDDDFEDLDDEDEAG